LALELAECFFQGIWCLALDFDAVEVLFEGDVLRPLPEKPSNFEIKDTQPAVLGSSIGKRSQVALRYEMVIFGNLCHRYCRLSHFSARIPGGVPQVCEAVASPTGIEPTGCQFRPVQFSSV
jgi:hypothetical protein